MRFKPLVFLSLVLAFSTFAGAQSVLVSEDFSTATGFTPPAGWSISLTAGTAGVDGWRFDNPGLRAESLPLAAPVAIVDTDFSGPNLAVQARLDSPVFNASAANGLLLEWDQYHNPLASTINVLVWDGAVWNLVYTDSLGTPDPDFRSIDILAAAGGATNARVRFEYIGNYDWWWQLDNVKVLVPALVDVGVSSIDSPVPDPSACLPLTAAEPITVTVTNYGTSPLPVGMAIPVEYVLDGGAVVAETMVFQTTVAFGASESYTFATTADLSVLGNHLIDARTNLGGDGGPSNDAVLGYTVPSGAGASLVSVFPFLETFDASPSNQTTTPPPGWIQDQSEATGTDSDWYFRNAPTSSTNTGPPADHTSGSGYFAYVEDSVGNHPAVNLLTPCLDFFNTPSPRMVYWLYSNDSNAGGNQNFLAIDVISYPGSVATLDIVPPVGHVPGQAWTQQVVDLSAWAGQTVRVRFRGRSDGGSFTHDIAIDDVRIFDYQPGLGQAPQPGLAELDVNSAASGAGTGVAVGGPGPYYASTTAGNPLTMTFRGQPNQPIVLLNGPLNPGLVSYAGLGQFDIGTTLNLATGFPDGISVLWNGLVPSGLNVFFNTGPAGVNVLSFTTPVLPLGVVTTLQAVIYDGSPTLVSLTNAVELSVQ